MTATSLGVLFWSDCNVSELDSGDGCTHCDYTKKHWLAHFNVVQMLGGKDLCILLCKYHNTSSMVEDGGRRRSAAIIFKKL